LVLDVSVLGRAEDKLQLLLGDGCVHSVRWRRESRKRAGERRREGQGGTFWTPPLFVHPVSRIDLQVPLSLSLDEKKWLQRPAEESRNLQDTRIYSENLKVA
jgi:hypothetical protein